MRKRSRIVFHPRKFEPGTRWNTRLHERGKLKFGVYSDEERVRVVWNLARKAKKH